MSNFKSGFIAVVGIPNVGKSTLTNKIVGQKIAIISNKPQTTRNKILAIRTTKTSQMIFIDTPGIHKPRTKLGEYMVNAAETGIYDADVIVFVTEAGREITNTEREIVEKIKDSGIPAILAINKIDGKEKTLILKQITEFNELFPFSATVPLSARTGSGVEICIKEIEELLEAGPEFYPEEMVTDMQERVMAAEIIREKMLHMLEHEIPHGTAVEILDYKEEENIIKINANIYCEKASHKGIIIGKGGEMLKNIGQAARTDIEKMADKKVYLNLWVKVKDDWRNNNYLMKSFGFEEEI